MGSRGQQALAELRTAPGSPGRRRAPSRSNAGPVQQGRQAAVQPDQVRQLRRDDQQRRGLAEAGEHRRAHQVQHPGRARWRPPRAASRRPAAPARRPAPPTARCPAAAMPTSEAPTSTLLRADGPTDSRVEAAEQHRDQHRQEGGVQAGDQRHAGQARVGHRLRDHHDGHGHGGGDFAAQQRRGRDAASAGTATSATTGHAPS